MGDMTLVAQLLAQHLFIPRELYFESPSCSCGAVFNGGNHIVWSHHVAEIVLSNFGHKLTRYHREPE